MRSITRKPLGVILYSGPSAIDGQPIVVIATGFRRKSKNTKTGRMIQTWILRRDVAPHVAIHSGADRSVCGSCPLRGVIERSGRKRRNRRRACYVRIAQAPLGVWRAYHRGRYEVFDAKRHLPLFSGAVLRLGSYGDPAAAPYAIWSRLARVAKKRTGYTHQWREPRFWRFRKLVMASCETVQDAQTARDRGWRTFRTMQPGEACDAQEIHCPASKEMGARITCDRCGACNGADSNPARRSVAIWAHGGPSVIGSYRKLDLVNIGR
jgi:hypothetical protein